MDSIISILIKLFGSDEAKASLVDLGTKGEAAVNRVRSAMDQQQASGQRFNQQAREAKLVYAELFASSADFARAGATASQIVQLMGVSMDRAKQAVKQYAGTIAEGEYQTRGFLAAQEQMAIAGMQTGKTFSTIESTSGLAFTGVGRIRQGLTSLVAQTTGTIPVLDRIGVTLLSAFGASSAALIGVLAGVAAIGLAYRKLSEESRKTAEEQDKLTKALEHWYEIEKQGIGGERVLQLEAERAKIKALADEYARLNGLVEDTQKGELKSGATSTNALFGQYAGGAGSTNAFFQQMAGGVGSTNAVFTGMAAGASAVATALELKKKREVEDAAALDIEIQRGRARIEELALENAAMVALTAAHVAQQDKLMALTHARVEDAAASAHEAENIGLTGYALQRNDIMYKALMATQKAWNELNGEVRQRTLENIIANRNAELQVLRLKTAYADAAAATKLFADMQGQLKDIAAKNKAITDAQTTETAKQIKEAQKYQEEIEKIWRNGIDKIVTNGTKSFHNFFNDVLQLFTHLMDKMEQEARRLNTTLGTNYKALQLGAAAIVGGFSGYQSANPGIGFATGAIAGSAFGPGGTVVGALAGAAGGLLGAAKAQKEAADAWKQAYEQFQKSLSGLRASTGTPIEQALEALKQQTAALQQFIDSQNAALQSFLTSLPPGTTVNQSAIDQIRARSGGDQSQLDAYIAAAKKKITDDFIGGIVAAYNATRGPQGEYINALNQITKDYNDAIASARALGLGQDVLDKIEQTRIAREQQLAEAQAAAAKAAQDAADAIVAAARKLNAESQQNSLLRLFDATGQSDLAFALRQAIEVQKALADGLDATSVEMLKQAQAAEKLARDNQAAATAAQKVVDTQRQALQLQAQGIQAQINAQQQLLNTYRQAIDTARKFLDASKLGAQSPLGPEARYEEAKRQYLALANAASGGDVKAFQDLPNAITAFRQESRNMFASTQRYADDFNQTQIYLESLTDKFGTQATIQEQMLATLQQQLAAIQQQISIQQQTLDATKANKPPTAGEIAIAIGAPSGPRIDPTLPPGTGPIGRLPPRRIPVRNIDDLFTAATAGNTQLAGLGAAIGEVRDGVGRMHTTIATTATVQTEYQRQTKDNTKATVDGIGRLRPIDVGGPIR